MGVGTNLIWEKSLRQGWHKTIRPASAPDLKCTTSESVHVLGIVNLHVMMGDWQVRVDFGVVRNRAVSFLFGTRFIDRFVRRIMPVERKVVPYNSSPVQISRLMMLTTKDEQNHNLNEQSILIIEPDNVKSK